MPLILVALLMFAVQQSPIAAAPDRVSISLERTTCNGECPSYTVTVDAGGNVVYTGRAFVRVSGVQKTKVDPAEVAGLVRELEKICFFDLKDEYTRNGWDFPTTYVSLSLNGRTKRITDDGDAPDELRALERKIDEVTNTRHWVFIDAAGVREMQMSSTPLSLDQLNDYLAQAAAGGADEVETARALLDAGAMARGDLQHQGPLLRVGSAEMVALLIERGADVNEATSYGGTALIAAAGLRDVSVVEALLKAGANVNAANDEGWTPLWSAAGSGRPRTVEVLLKAGAAVSPSALEAARACVVEAERDQTLKNLPLEFTRGRPTVDDCRKIVALLEKRDQVCAKRSQRWH